MPNNEQVGEPPNAEDTFWLEVANKMTPDKSIERIDTFGKYLFSTVSIVGTLLTGFGIFSPLGSTFFKNPSFIIPIALACLSLALAMMGITPRRGKLRRQNIYSIRNYYNRLIQVRGRFIFWSGVAFAASLLSIAIVFGFFMNPNPISPTLSVRLTGSGEKTMLTGKVEITELYAAGIVEVEILGFQQSKTVPKSTVLFKEVAHGEQTGKVTVVAELDGVQAYKRFLLHARVKSGNQLLYEEKAEIVR